MWRAELLACTSCHDKSHCIDCRAYSQSPVAFKALTTKKKLSTSSTYSRTASHLTSSTIPAHSICSQCDSKMCFACSMYNTQFLKV